MPENATLGGVIDSALQNYKPSQIVFGTSAAIAATYIVAVALEPGNILKRMDKAKWGVIRRLAAPIVSKEVNKAASTITFKSSDDDSNYFNLPEEGKSKDEVLELCYARQKSLDHDYSRGECSGTVYHGGADYTDFMNKVMQIFTWSNPLHVDVFGAVRKMEAEVVSMTLSMYNGQAARSGTACGALSSGGTESIGMAMRAYREQAKKERGFKTFSIVAPITAHPAFNKAAEYYGMEIIPVPIDDSTGMVDPNVLEKYIRHDTVVIIGSAPCFPTGTIDRIPELAEIALKHNVGLHVDACLGGFIVPFLGRAGFDAPLVDFRVHGVTSISADTHKYGFAPKGTSVVLYHSKELRQYQFFALAVWPGGMYCSPGAAGSKAGNVIAGTWAAMVSAGFSGYTDTCRKIVGANRAIIKGLKTVPSIRVLGTPTASVVGFTSDRVDCFELNALLCAKGWMLNPLQFPSGLQFSVTLLQSQEGVAERFVADVRESVETLVAKLPPGGVAEPTSGASMYGSQQKIADRTIIADVLRCFLDKYYTVA